MDRANKPLQDTEHRAVGVGPVMGGRRYALIIDDDVHLRRAVEDLLAAYQIESEGVGDGEQALTFLRSRPTPAVILLDLRMPGMGGVGFRMEQLKDPALKSIPVILLKGDSDEDPVDASLGKLEVFRKVAGANELLTLVRNFL